MLKLLSCNQGHYWEETGADAKPSPASCPTCGRPAETMPLLDLAATEEPPPPSAEPPTPPTPPPLLDKEGRPVVVGYEIQQDLGKGPTSVHHYRARQLLVNRIVVLKIVYAREDHSQLAWGSLRGEATALGRLTHANVVRILEAGERERQLFYNAVEFVDGPTLAEYAQGKQLPIRQALELVETLARAVHHAHQQNVLHRNLKPSAILLVPPVEDGARRKESSSSPLGTPKITDFGLARRLLDGDASDVELQGGLPCYLAPEQAWGRAKEVGPATDVYALGAILFELIGGRPPFRGETVADTLDAIQGREAPPLSRFRSRVPGDVEAVCRKCLAKAPRRRYTSAQELADDLRRCLNGHPVRARSAGSIERFGKWLRRHFRGVALLMLGLWLGVSLAGLIAASRGPSSAEPAAREQNDQRRIASLEANLSQVRRRQAASDYLAYLTLARRESDSRNPEQGQQLLERCPEDLRHWEWWYVRSLLQDAPRATRFQLNVPITALDLTSDGRYLAAVGGIDAEDKFRGSRGEGAIWDVQTGQRLWYEKFPTRANGITFSPDGASFAFIDSGNPPGRAKWLQARRTLMAGALFGYLFPDSQPTSVAYSVDGQQLLAICDNGNVHTLSALNGQLVREQQVLFSVLWPERAHARLLPVPQPQQPDRLALISPDGGQVVIMSGAYTPLRPTELPRGDETTFLSLAYDRRNDRLAASALDGTIRIWHLNATGQSPTVLHGHKGAVNGITFSLDGQRLASCGADGTVRIWNVEQELELLKLTGFKGASGVCFRPAAHALQQFQRHFDMIEPDNLIIAHGNVATVLHP